MSDSPGDSIMKINNERSVQTDDFTLDSPRESTPAGRRGKSGVFTVIVSGLALFSDGYNAQISTDAHQRNSAVASWQWLIRSSSSWLYEPPLRRGVSK